MAGGRRHAFRRVSVCFRGTREIVRPARAHLFAPRRRRRRQRRRIPGAFQQIIGVLPKIIGFLSLSMKHTQFHPAHAFRGL